MLSNNKGMSYVLISFMMLIVFGLVTSIWKLGINDITMSKLNNDISKAYFVSEAGVYYAGSVILEAVQAVEEPQDIDLSLNDAVNKFEKRYIQEVLKKNKWQKGKTAACLKISRKTLFRKMKSHEIN